MKVVYNACHGGFGVSDHGREWLKERKLVWDGSRHCPNLVAMVEDMGCAAGDSFAKLEICEVEFPYRIDEYDGYEDVATPGSYDWVTQ